MRQLPKRPNLSKVLIKRLADETAAIVAHLDPKSEADRRYANARKAKWFKPIVDALAKVSGPGQRCMFCSGSESSDVEHYRPKGVVAFAPFAMTWENYLWCCTPCNRNKLNRFPPDTEPGGRFVNPLDENVWDFFFIDEFGILTPVFDSITGSLNQRAVTTRDFLSLDRDAVQESRKIRLDDLRGQVEDTMRLLKLGEISVAQARQREVKWREQPFQPDVADYFLKGPGKKEQPFRNFLALL